MKERERVIDVVADGETIQMSMRLQGGTGRCGTSKERRNIKRQELRNLYQGDLGERSSPRRKEARPSSAPDKEEGVSRLQAEDGRNERGAHDRVPLVVQSVVFRNTLDAICFRK